MRNKIFAERLKQLRVNQNMTQEQMSVVFNVVQQAVQKWESGVNMPKKNKIVEIASYFKVSTDWLLGYSDKDMPLASLGSDERRLLNGFWSLNDIGQKRLFETMDDLIAIPKYTEKRYISIS